MAAELWGDVDGVKVKSAKYGKGMILNGLTMQEAFGLIECAPDCQLPEGVPSCTATARRVISIFISYEPE